MVCYKQEQPRIHVGVWFNMGLTGPDKVDHHTMVNPEKMANERTPLITSVRTAPPRQRYGHHVVRRFCTIAITCSLISLFATFLLGFGYTEKHRHHELHDGEWSWPGSHGRKLSYEDLKQVLLDTPTSEKAEEWQRYYTAGAHLAGQNFSQVCHLSRTLPAEARHSQLSHVGTLDEGEMGGVGHCFYHR